MYDTHMATSLPKIIAILGPTASGKTALGESLAITFSGEIVSADAKQVYKGMDIGTAKELQLKVPQHLIDIKDPGTKITVCEYQRLAYDTIDEILRRSRVPFLVGGSMLYAESVMNGYIFSKGIEKSKSQEPCYQFLKLGITIDRTRLKERVRKRTRQWVQDGLLDEIKELLKSGVSREWLMACGQEYRYFTKYILGEISLEEAESQVDISLDQYIKRQYTWWRRHKDIVWVQDEDEATKSVEAFLR